MRWLRLAFGIGIFLLAAGALRDVIAGYRWNDFIRLAAAVPRVHLILAIALSLTGYAVMTGYDTIAFRYVDRALPYGWIAFASFTGYAINNTLGLSGIVGSTLRYRFYRGWGIRAGEIARVFVFCTVTYWLGFVLLGGSVFLLAAPRLPPSLHIPFGSMRAFGALMLVPALLYVFWITVQRRPLRVREWEIQLPAWPIFIAQLAISMGDWTLAGGVLNVVLPPSAHIPFVSVLAVFLLAQIAGLVSNVPGGLGVFDFIVVRLLSPYFSTAPVLGALLVFRGVYFLLPLAMALLLLAAHEVFVRRIRN